MRIALDLPLYAVIALVGALAMSGHASSSEMVIASLGALLARTLPPGARNAAAGTGIALLVLQAALGVGPAEVETAATRAPRAVETTPATAIVTTTAAQEGE